jgi:hypothetical protein
MKGNEYRLTDVLHYHFYENVFIRNIDLEKTCFIKHLKTTTHTETNFRIFLS